jgi:2-dehydropantoate 2-reductase
MKILVIGAGVIGTIYGYALAQAGNDVTHYVRPGKKVLFEDGVQMRLLDGRMKKPKEMDQFYAMKVTESIPEGHDYELILVSVRHNQIDSVLPLLKEHAGGADVLFFNGTWDTFERVDAALSRAKYLWGFPVAGGGYHGRKLEAALLDEVRIGEVDGQITPRVERIRAAFEGAGLKVDVQKDMLQWLWVHFAINCGVIAAAFKAGGSKQLLDNILRLREAILAGREALAVCRARGVDVMAYEDAKAFYLPVWIAAAGVWFTMKTNLPARKIMETHTAIDELQHMYADLQRTADELNVPMPIYKSLQGYVEHPQVELSGLD